MRARREGVRGLAVSALLCGVALASLASCGGDKADTSKQATATASGGPAAPDCRARDLRILKGSSNGATGHIVLGFRIQAVSGPRCSLYGFPRVALLPRTGRLRRVTVEPRSSDFFGHVPKRVVIVPPGGLASFRLSLEDAINGGDCPFARGLRVTVPGDPQPRVLRERFLACPGGVTVSPVARGRSAYQAG
jgi:Protein of unknown function (DUF4232)